VGASDRVGRLTENHGIGRERPGEHLRTQACQLGAGFAQAGCEDLAFLELAAGTAAQQPAFGHAVERLRRQFLNLDLRYGIAVRQGLPGAVANLRQVRADQAAADRTEVMSLGETPVSQVALGGHAAIKTNEASATATALFEFFDQGVESLGVTGVAGERFVAEGKAIAVDGEADAQLLAIGAMVAGIAALGLGIAGHASFEVGTC